ncbi:MAG: hypothetical protein M5U17_09020 [Ignavibacterium sp.]|nr:hypothetical protein [Ignavibacterium sp.]
MNGYPSISVFSPTGLKKPKSAARLSLKNLVPNEIITGKSGIIQLYDKSLTLFDN